MFGKMAPLTCNPTLGFVSFAIRHKFQTESDSNMNTLGINLGLCAEHKGAPTPHLLDMLTRKRKLFFVPVVLLVTELNVVVFLFVFFL